MSSEPSVCVWLNACDRVPLMQQNPLVWSLIVNDRSSLACTFPPSFQVNAAAPGSRGKIHEQLWLFFFFFLVWIFVCIFMTFHTFSGLVWLNPHSDDMVFIVAYNSRCVRLWLSLAKIMKCCIYQICQTRCFAVNCHMKSSRRFIYDKCLCGCVISKFTW